MVLIRLVGIKYVRDLHSAHTHLHRDGLGQGISWSIRVESEVRSILHRSAGSWP